MGRVCLFAQYDPHHRIGPHVVGYVGHLQRCGYRTIVACSGTRLPPLADREALRATGAELVFRPNRGHDFGAWAHLVRDGYANGADAVLLANDSVFGPFADLAPIFRRMDAKGYDVWGMVDSRQHNWHLQSWFLHFTGQAFANPAVARLFGQDFARMDKDDIIDKGELAMGRVLLQEGMRCGALAGHSHASWLARRHPLNPMHIDWRFNLVTGRLPFLKADLLRANMMEIPWAPEWESVLRDRLKADPGPINAYLFGYTGRTPDHPGASYPVPVGSPSLAKLAFYALSSRDRLPALRALFRGLKSSLHEESPP